MKVIKLRNKKILTRNSLWSSNEIHATLDSLLWARFSENIFNIEQSIFEQLINFKLAIK